MTPKDLFLALNNIINPEFVHATPKLLTEDGAEATCREVRLVHNGQIATYKFDKSTSVSSTLFPFFNKTAGNAHGMCDFIVLYPKENQLHVLICNLKSKNLSNSHDQVQAGYLFAVFLVQTAARCLSKAHIPDFVKFTAVHFTTINKFRRPLTGGKPLPLKVYDNNLKYDLLPCNTDCHLDVLSKRD